MLCDFALCFIFSYSFLIIGSFLSAYKVLKSLLALKVCSLTFLFPQDVLYFSLFKQGKWSEYLERWLWLWRGAGSPGGQTFERKALSGVLDSSDGGHARLWEASRRKNWPDFEMGWKWDLREREGGRNPWRLPWVESINTGRGASFKGQMMSSLWKCWGELLIQLKKPNKHLEVWEVWSVAQGNICSLEITGSQTCWSILS